MNALRPIRRKRWVYRVPGGASAPTRAAGSAYRLLRKVVAAVNGIEAPEFRCAQHDNVRRIDAWTPPESAAHPCDIASDTRGRCRVVGVLQGLRCKVDSVWHCGRRWDGSVFHLHCFLAPGLVDLVLELLDTRRQGLHLRLARRIAGHVVACRSLWSGLMNDLGHANTLGRSKIADVDRPGRIDPRIDVRMSKRQPKSSGKYCRESGPQEIREHSRLPITTTTILGRCASVVY